MTAQSSGRGVSGLETPLEGHPGPAQLDLEAICERVDAATKGPWVVQTPHVYMGGRTEVRVTSAVGPKVFADIMLLGDAEFIAAARTDVPALLAEVQRLHTWAGLMSVVDEQYPITVFPVAGDRSGVDDGVRILSLLRHLDEARRPEWAQTILDQRDAAFDAVARVRKLHAQSNPPYRDHCTGCLGAWPCETVQALEGKDG